MKTTIEIRKVDIYPLSVPLKASFNIVTSSLAAIDNLAVAIELSDGSRGWGEVPIMPPTTNEDRQVAMQALEQEATLLAGKNAAGWRKIAADLLERLPDYAAVRCGLEMALLDALMQSWQIPLFRFFGGCSDRVVTDITIPICPAEEAEHLAGQYQARGFRTIKTKIGHDTEKDIGRILAIKRGFRECELILDANTGYTVDETLVVLKELRKAGIVPALLEQPLDRDDREGMGQLAREAGIPVAADESCRSPRDALQIARDALAQVINIKLAKCGVVQALEIAAIARAANIGLMVGGMVETRIAMGFSAHFAAGLGGFEWIDLDTPLLLAQDPVEGGYITEGPCYMLDTGTYGHGGKLTVREGPGNDSGE